MEKVAVGNGGVCAYVFLKHEQNTCFCAWEYEIKGDNISRFSKCPKKLYIFTYKWQSPLAAVGVISLFEGSKEGKVTLIEPQIMQIIEVAVDGWVGKMSVFKMWHGCLFPVSNPERKLLSSPVTAVVS